MVKHYGNGISNYKSTELNSQQILRKHYYSQWRIEASLLGGINGQTGKMGRVVIEITLLQKDAIQGNVPKESGSVKKEIDE